jgi:hypothetical protein
MPIQTYPLRVLHEVSIRLQICFQTEKDALKNEKRKRKRKVELFYFGASCLRSSA